MDYSSRHVQILHKITAETVRTWSQEFAEFLSPTANPGKGRNRIFTEKDMQVFSLVSELKARGLTYEDIHAALHNGQIGELPPAPATVEAMALEREEQSLAIQVERMRDMVALLTQQRDELQTMIQPVKDENIRLQAQLEAAQKRAQEDAEQRRLLTEDIAHLNREIGKLQAKLEIYENRKSNHE